jgi:hypothetical protein
MAQSAKGIAKILLLDAMRYALCAVQLEIRGKLN